MFYRKHVFICVNQKEAGKKCCALSDINDGADYLRSLLRDSGGLGAGKVKISTSGCLGRCKAGPALVVYPEGVWYRYDSKEEIAQIADSHLKKGKIVEELRIVD